MLKLENNKNYMQFATVEMIQEIFRIKRQFKLTDEELLAIMGTILFEIGETNEDKE